MTTVGFIGLGRMGRPMASNLLTRGGFDLVVYDIAAEPVEILAKLGARPADGVAGVASVADIIVTMLPTAKEVEAIILGPDGILANGRPGQIIIDMSTIEPETTIRIAAAVAEKGVSMIDAPVGRLASHADRGESLFMVGASDADFDRAKPLLEAMGTTILHCGPVGAGGQTKLVNNYLCVVSCQMNAEALAMTQSFGLDLAKTLEVLHGTTATNGQLKMNWATKVLIDDISPGFTIDLAHKDLSLIIASAQSGKVPMPLGAAAREAFNMARASGYGGKDFSGIVDYLCETANLPKPRLPKT